MASGTNEERRAELVRTERRRRRIYAAGAFASSTGFAAVACAGVLALADEEVGAAPPLWLLGAVGVLLGAAGLVAVWGSRPGEAAAELEAGLTRRDRVQRSRNATFLTFAASALAMAAVAANSGLHVQAGEGEGFDHLWVAGVPLLFVVFPLAVAGRGWWGRADVRKWLEDEFTPLLRGRAFQVGYFGLLAGALALYFVGLYRPEWVGVVGPALLAPGAVLPAVWFAVLDRRADPDE